MSLARDVAARLEAEGVGFALIGAVAMAVHGVSRSTAAIDFLSVEEGLLKRELWTDFEERGATVRLLKGDLEDPLAGSVRILLEGDEIVDVVVGRYRWQEEIIQVAEVTSIGEFAVKVVRPSGLVLLKLYAGGRRICGTSTPCSRAMSRRTPSKWRSTGKWRSFPRIAASCGAASVSSLEPSPDRLVRSAKSKFAMSS